MNTTIESGVDGWRIVDTGSTLTGLNVYIAKESSDGILVEDDSAEYLHSDGIARRTTRNDQNKYTGWFQNVEEAKLAIEVYKRIKEPMSEMEFIDKWRGLVTGWWATSADALFWARSYKMGQEDLVMMCRDYMSTRIENRAPCCLDVVRRTLGCI